MWSTSWSAASTTKRAATTAIRTSNDGMTDMILYCQFDIKGGALRMLQIPRNSLVATTSRKVTLSNGKTYAASNYQINSVALSNGGSIAALAEVIYDQYKLPIDYYVTVDMQALVEMVDNFGGIEVYIPHDMSFAGSALKQGYRNLDGASAEFFVRCRHGQGYSNSDIDRLNMQRYFYAGLFKRVRSMGITDVLNQLPLVFNNYIHTDMDLTTIAKMLVSFTRIDSANIMLAQTPVFMGVPNVGVTDSFDGYSCVVPDAGSIAELLNTYFRNYTGPVSASELNLVTDSWPHGTASTSANVQFVGQLDKESDDAILSGDTDVAGATTTDGQPASDQQIRRKSMDNNIDSKTLAIEIAKILDKKKAQDVRVLKVESLTVLDRLLRHRVRHLHHAGRRHWPTRWSSSFPRRASSPTTPRASTPRTGCCWTTPTSSCTSSCPTPAPTTTWSTCGPTASPSTSRSI